MGACWDCSNCSCWGCCWGWGLGVFLALERLIFFPLSLLFEFWVMSICFFFWGLDVLCSEGCDVPRCWWQCCCWKSLMCCCQRGLLGHWRRRWWISILGHWWRCWDSFFGCRWVWCHWSFQWVFNFLGGISHFYLLWVTCVHLLFVLTGFSASGAMLVVLPSDSFGCCMVSIAFCGQAFTRWLTYLQFQQCGYLPSLSREYNVSGMAGKPFLLRHSLNT